MSRFLLVLCLSSAILSVGMFGMAWGEPAPGYSWQPFSDGSTDQVKLMRGALQVGVYRTDDGTFAWLLRDGTFSPDGVPPIDPPAAGGLARGVESREVVPGRVMLNGRVTTRRQAVEALGATVPDTTSCRWVTVIGTGREKVEGDWKAAPELAPYTGGTILKSYPADHWALRPGFALKGAPTLYVQSSDGRVLSHADGYDGPQALARALRKADPNYDPAKDPDLSKVPAPPPVPPAPPAPPAPLPPLVGPPPAPEPLPPAPPPFAGPVTQPQPSLSALAGQVPAGVWSLVVSVLAGFGFLALKTAKVAS